MSGSITSANSVFTLMVAGLFPAPVQMQGYAVDKAFASDSVDYAEVQMGVDGRMTAGYTPVPQKMTVSLQADSPSREFFAAIIAATKAARDVYYLTGDIVLPSTGEKFALVRGVLSAGKPMPDAGKVLQPVDYVITWESVNRSPL